MTRKPTPTAIADVLDKAADIIDRNGWHQGDLYDGHQADVGVPVSECRVCAIGAINTAISGQATADLAGYDLLLAGLAETCIDEVLDQGWWTVPEWNDAAGRTQDDVTTALRNAAARMREAA